MLTPPLPAHRERARVAQRVRRVLGDGVVGPTDRLDDDGLDDTDPLRDVSDDVGRPDSGRGAGPGAGFGSGPGSRWSWGSLRSGGLRIDPGRRGAAAVGAAAVVAAVVTGVWVFSARPRALPVSAAVHAPASASSSMGIAAAGPSTRAAPVVGPASTPASGRPVASPSAGADVVVDVAGQVRRPGLYTLPAGARVDDAIRAAGGANPGVSLTSLNLASRVSDGEQIVVGVTGVPPLSGGGSAAGPAGASSVGGPAAPVNLNTATLEGLETLPGIGPAMGQRILEWRAAHGGFTAISQLNDVAGIGDVKYAQLRPLVTV